LDTARSVMQPVGTDTWGECGGPNTTGANAPLIPPAHMLTPVQLPHRTTGRGRGPPPAGKSAVPPRPRPCARLALTAAVFARWQAPHDLTKGLPT
jgi:hypothetical protein